MAATLLTKTRRDLRRRLPQFAAIGATVLLGVLLFVASAQAYRNLDASYDATYERLRFADLTAVGGDPSRLSAVAREAGGVAAVTERTVGDVPLQIGPDKLLGRVVGLPAAEQPAVNQVDVTAGRYLDGGDPDGVLVEAHAAETFGLEPGDRVLAFYGGGWRDLTVRGVAESPEYLWPARSRQQILADPHSFAVLFAPEPTARSLAGGAPGVRPETLVELTPAARAADAGAAVADRLRAAGAVDVQPRSEQPSHTTLLQDLQGISQLSVVFPALFLSAAAIAAYVLITRLVLSERKVIATFLAAGSPRGPVVRHYLGHGVLVGTAAAVVGVLLGSVATAGLTRAYTTALDIPDTVVNRSPALAALGVLFGALVGLLGGAAPAVATSRTAPAEAMRGEMAGARAQWRPRGRAGLGVARRARHARPQPSVLQRLPTTWRMALRELSRSRRRTLATMGGTVLSLVLVLASVGMATTMVNALDVQFDEVQRADATVTADPAAQGLEQALGAVEGVARVEPVTTVPVTLAAGARSYSTSLSGYEPGTAMRGFRTPDGGFRDLPAQGLLVGAAIGERLGVGVGEAVELTTPGSPPRQVALAGLLEEPLGTFAYATRDTVQELTGVSVNGYQLRLTPAADEASRDAVRAAVSGLPGVVAYTDEEALEQQVDDYLGLFWVFVGIMLGLGTVLALTIIYVTMTVNIAERTVQLATLRAAGVPVRRIAGLLAAENLTAAVLATPVGLLAGVLAAWAALQAFQTDLFALRLTLGWTTLLSAAAAVLAASLLSQLPAIRAIRQLDVATVVRERA